MQGLCASPKAGTGKGDESGEGVRWSDEGVKHM